MFFATLVLSNRRHISLPYGVRILQHDFLQTFNSYGVASTSKGGVNEVVTLWESEPIEPLQRGVILLAPNVWACRMRAE
jgi:hypothetical protein